MHSAACTLHAARPAGGQSAVPHHRLLDNDGVHIMPVQQSMSAMPVCLA